MPSEPRGGRLFAKIGKEAVNERSPHVGRAGGRTGLRMLLRPVALRQACLAPSCIRSRSASEGEITVKTGFSRSNWAGANSGTMLSIGCTWQAPESGSMLNKKTIRTAGGPFPLACAGVLRPVAGHVDTVYCAKLIDPIMFAKPAQGTLRRSVEKEFPFFFASPLITSSLPRARNGNIEKSPGFTQLPFGAQFAQQGIERVLFARQTVGS